MSIVPFADIEKKWQAYWEQKKTFRAKLLSLDGKRVSIASESQADAILERLEGKDYIVQRVEQSERRRKPGPPFTTSKLQQAGVIRSSRHEIALVDREGVRKIAEGA